MNQESTQKNLEDKKRKLTGLGELLRRSWKIYKENFGVLIKISFVPLFLGGLPLVAGALYSFSFSVKYFLFQAISTALSSFIFYWLTASLVFAVKNRERKIDFKEALKSGIKWILPLFWIGILSSIVVLGGTMLLIIPGIVLSVWFCLTGYVLIYEDKRGMDALLKSKDIVSGNWWNVFWRNIVVSGVYLIISLPFDLLLFFLIFISKETAFVKYDYALVVFQLLPLLFIYSFQIIYSALIYENLQEIKGKLEFKTTLKRKLKYLLPVILAIVIIGGIGGLTFWGLYSGYKSMEEEDGGKETIDLAKVMFEIEIRYSKEGKYPGVFGSNQWNILESELKTDLPNGNYEYWVSDDNQKYILKATLKDWSVFLDDDIDGEPLGHGLVNCGIQGKEEKEYCIGNVENAQNKVTITTDKIEYEEGETVKIMIKNNTDFFWKNYDNIDTDFTSQQIGWGFVESYEQGQWKKKEPLWRCNKQGCFAICIPPPPDFFLLKPKEEKTFEWDQQHLLCSEPEYKETEGRALLISDRYRVSGAFANIVNEEEVPEEFSELFYSPEFKIKWKIENADFEDTGIKETKNFIIRTQYEEMTISEDVIDLLNNTYSKIGNDLGIKNLTEEFIGEERINVLIYKDSSEYHNATGRPSWSQGFNDYETRTIHLIQGTNFNTIIPHELAHLLLKHRFPPKTQDREKPEYYTTGYMIIPDWIHEGFAFYEEEKFDSSYVKSRLSPQLDGIKKGNYLTYNDLLEKSPSETGQKDYLWYAQSLSMVKYLIQEYGMDRFLQLSGYLAEEKSIDGALWKFYQNTELVEEMGTQALNEILIERWFEYVKNRDIL